MPDESSIYALFVGTWQLQSWTISNSQNDQVSEPFGAVPAGLISYSTDGWMSAAVSRSERELFAGNLPLRKQDNLALANAFKSYFHYAGPYRIEGDTVIHTVVMSLNPNMVGTEQHRRFVFNGDNLILSGEESAGTMTRYHSLLWQRA